MTTLITIISDSNPHLKSLSKLFKLYDKCFVFCDAFWFSNFQNEKVKKIQFDKNSNEKDLFSFFVNKIKENKIDDFEIDINLFCSNGFEATCLINALIKNGISFNFVFLDEQKINTFFEV